MCALLKISIPQVIVGMTVAFTSRDTSSGLSFLRRGMSLYSLVEAAVAHLEMCVSSLRFLVSHIPTDLCSLLLRIVSGRSVTGAVC